MSFERESTPDRAERQARWTTLEENVNELADRLGHPIDKGIQEAVVGLHAHGIETAQSCEGHDDHGNALPMILIEAEKPPDWEENEEAKTAWATANTAMVEKMQVIVDEWYRQREENGEVVPDDHRLILQPRGIFGAADLESASQERLTALTESERRQQAGEYRGEMQKFSAYLKERFLSGMSS